MGNMKRFWTRDLLLVPALLVGLAAGWYGGHQDGFVKGLTQGTVSGYKMSSNEMTAVRLRKEFDVLPASSRQAAAVICAGLRSGLPCGSVAEADRMILSNDPAEQLTGQSCRATLMTLGACGVNESSSPTELKQARAQ